MTWSHFEGPEKHFAIRITFFMFNMSSIPPSCNLYEWRMVVRASFSKLAAHKPVYLSKLLYFYNLRSHITF